MSDTGSDKDRWVQRCAKRSLIAKHPKRPRLYPAPDMGIDRLFVVHNAFGIKSAATFRRNSGTHALRCVSLGIWVWEEFACEE